MRTIVVSAVNLKVGGTLTVLRDCLAHLSAISEKYNYRIVAIVYKRELVDYPGIEYIETKWPKKNWINRLWYEYVSMKGISRRIGEIDLWISLHDTTPNVIAKRRVVYCHNPFPFYRWKWRELFFAPKIVLFALFSEFIYRYNIKKNKYVIVQQQWIKNAFKRRFNLPESRIIVALPESKGKESLSKENRNLNSNERSFIYASSANSHKNFECLCEATALLNNAGIFDFKVYITIDGDENAYARWLKHKWGGVSSLIFIGFQDREALFEYYREADCLVFPSKIETWGLPISEFAETGKPMLLADLPYAHETAAGNDLVAFFHPDKPEILAQQIDWILHDDKRFLRSVPRPAIEDPSSRSWEELFDILLDNKSFRKSQ